MKDVVVILGSSHRPADRAALSLAVRGMGARTRALCTDEAAMRYALGAGVEGGWLLDEQDIVAATYDVAIVGACHDLVGATLAEARDAAMVCDVLDAAWMKDGDLRVTRDLGRGAKDVLQIKGPAVLCMGDEAGSALYVSRYRRAAVKRLPPRGRTIIESGEADWRAVRPRTKTGEIAAKTGGSATSRSHAIFGVGEDEGGSKSAIVQGDAGVCAEHLVRYLAHHGFVEGHVVEEKREVDRAKPQAAEKKEVVVGEVSGRLARGPRPVGQALPARVRGPFPIGS